MTTGVFPRWRESYRSMRPRKDGCCCRDLSWFVSKSNEARAVYPSCEAVSRDFYESWTVSAWRRAIDGDLMRYSALTPALSGGRGRWGQPFLIRARRRRSW